MLSTIWIRPMLHQQRYTFDSWTPMYWSTSILYFNRQLLFYFMTIYLTLSIRLMSAPAAMSVNMVLRLKNWQAKCSATLPNLKNRRSPVSRKSTNMFLSIYTYVIGLVHIISGINDHLHNSIINHYTFTSCVQ